MGIHEADAQRGFVENELKVSLSIWEETARNSRKENEGFWGKILANFWRDGDETQMRYVGDSPEIQMRFRQDSGEILVRFWRDSGVSVARFWRDPCGTLTRFILVTHVFNSMSSLGERR